MSKRCIILVLFLIMTKESISQIYSLPKYPTTILNNENGTIEIKEFNLMIDRANIVYQNDSIVFQRKGDYEYCTIEISSNFLLFTKRTKEQNMLAYLYILPKHEIMLYNLLTKKWFEANLQANQFEVIDETEKNILVKNSIGDRIKIEYKEIKPD